MFNLRAVLPLTFLLAAIGCGDEAALPTVDCATPAVPTYAMVTALTTSCVNCHSSTLSGGARFGAPTGLDYNTFASAMTNATEGAAEIFAGSMPPAPAIIAEADKQVYYRWALCGTPQ